MVVFFLIIYVYACVGASVFLTVLKEDYVYDADDDAPLDDSADVLNAQVFKCSLFVDFYRWFADGLLTGCCKF